MPPPSTQSHRKKNLRVPNEIFALAISVSKTENSKFPIPMQRLFFIIIPSEVRLSPLGIAATNWPIVTAIIAYTFEFHVT
jgi:hypothetical protein